MITSEDIKRRLWDGANELRGSMDASRYKDYMLGLMFYKFLSDKTLDTFKRTSGMKESDEAKVVEAYREAYEQYGEQLTKMIHDVLGYYVVPDYLYQTWLQDIQTGNFEVQKVTDSLNYFERTIAVTGDSDDFKGLFSTTAIDLTDTALGSNLNERSKNIRALILLFADLNMVALQKGDVLGDAYEYLIGQFAMAAGKKAGEFYTPHQVSEVMAQIVAKASDISSIYDPTVGSGSLLLTVGKHLEEDAQKKLSYYGQERNTATYNLTRMNLLLHGVRPEKMTVKNGDTLGPDWPEDPEKPNEGVQFDAVVMNPPYSFKNWNSSDLKVSDPRFEVAGVLPPDSRGDYAFLLHGLFHLGQNGTMAIVLPHGVLFRGGAEEVIRKRLIDKNYIDTVIGLPIKLFTNTDIPVSIMILRKNREIGTPILMIDASKDFTKNGKQNILQEKDIAKIVDTYTGRDEIPGYSYLATPKDLRENEYNLNIRRYVEVVEEDIPQNVDAHLHGGIPKIDIDRLKTLQETVPTLLQQSLEEIRPGYVELTKSIETLTTEVLTDAHVIKKSTVLETMLQTYMDTYWNLLKNIADVNEIPGIRDEMLREIKDLLTSFHHVNVYEGYQIIAELWANKLTEDAEIIGTKDFYTAGRTRVENMVTKGTGQKKRVEQDGWVGAIVSTDLIKQQLHATELADIEVKKKRLQEVEAEINKYVEAAKVEENEEAFVLGDALNLKETGFTIGAVRTELKATEQDTEAYNLLQKVEQLMSERSTIDRAVKALEKSLKEVTEERIEVLTDTEIDALMYEKWFGNIVGEMTRLIENPLKGDLEMLKMLKERYTDTLATIDETANQLDQELETLMQELEVQNW